MNYKSTLDYLFAQLPMYHRVGAVAFKKDLTNIVALCKHLGNPQERFLSIHVGGTNGKGSVSHFLAAICQAAGLKTGLYISPHYKDFRERIKINGQYIPQRKVVSFVEQHRPVLETIQPSFFEMTVAMAFDHFAQAQVDIAIIEVGLGGRLDSTNVVTPLLSVITNISLDHQAMLGDTLAQIAFEKAGIIKAGIPVVIGEEHPESMPVFKAKATECDADLYNTTAHWAANEIAAPNADNTMYQVFRDGALHWPQLALDAAGPFQAKNICTALQAVEVLKKTAKQHAEKGENMALMEVLANISEANIREGLGNLRALTRFMGRWQQIGQQPTILCDSAHNEAGIRSAFGKIKEMHPTGLHIVTGFVNDKDVDKVLGLFPTQARYYFAKANIPRGLEAKVLQEKAGHHGLEGKSYTSVKNALKAAKRAASKTDLIVVIGSIFVVAEVI